LQSLWHRDAQDRLLCRDKLVAFSYMAHACGLFLRVFLLLHVNSATN